MAKDPTQKERPMPPVPEQKERPMPRAGFQAELRQKERPMFRVFQDQQKNLEKKLRAFITYHEACAKAAAKLVADLKKIDQLRTPGKGRR